MGIIYSCTGHRPDKLGNEYNGGPITNRIRHNLKEIILRDQIDEGISGGALGVDTEWAEVLLECGVKLTVAVPFKGQESKWQTHQQKRYYKLLERAYKIVVVSGGSYSPKKMQIRNEWMVDNSTKLVAVWDGSPGGTANCVNYAKSIQREIIIICPT